MLTSGWLGLWILPLFLKSNLSMYVSSRSTIKATAQFKTYIYRIFLFFIIWNQKWILVFLNLGRLVTLKSPRPYFSWVIFTRSTDRPVLIKLTVNLNFIDKVIDFILHVEIFIKMGVWDIMRRQGVVLKGVLLLRNVSRCFRKTANFTTRN